MRRRRISALLVCLPILLWSCGTYKPLSKPYEKSVVRDLAVGDMVGMRIEEGNGIERIEKMKIQEILGDTVLVGTQIIDQGSEASPAELPRRIYVSKIVEIGKGQLGQDGNVIVWVIAFWVLVAGIGTVALY